MSLAIAALTALGSASPARPDGNVCLWDRAGFDGRTAQASISSYWTGEQQTADDMYVPPQVLQRVRRVTATLLTDSIVPKARLRVYADCNGTPAALLFTQDSTIITDRGQTFAGLRIVTVEFDPSVLWLEGGPSGRTYWVSITGVAATPTDQWYWATSGNGAPAGLPGMFIAPAAGAPTWTSVAEFGCGCTDFAFRVDGDECKVLWDNGRPDPAGGAALSLTDSTGTIAKAADNFTVPPCQDAAVCFVRAVVYSNCSPVLGRFEVFPGNCALPTDPPIVSAPFTRTIDLGYSVTIDGLTLEAFEAQAYDLNWVLPAGRTYWLATSGVSGGSVRARTYFAFSSECDRCPIRLGGGAVSRPAQGLPGWTLLEQVTGQPHDFSFMLAITPPAPAPATPGCAADVDHDGIVTIRDLFQFLSTWFAGCP